MTATSLSAATGGTQVVVEEKMISLEILDLQPDLWINVGGEKDGKNNELQHPIFPRRVRG